MIILKDGRLFVKANKEKLKETEHKTPPKEYREGGAKKQSDYAAPGFKYPIDNEEHTRAALSYFAKPENHNMYSESERKTIARKICSAAKKYKIDTTGFRERMGLKKEGE